MLTDDCPVMVFKKSHGNVVWDCVYCGVRNIVHPSKDGAGPFVSCFQCSTIHPTIYNEKANECPRHLYDPVFRPLLSEACGCLECNYNKYSTRRRYGFRKCYERASAGMVKEFGEENV
jgi:hypothetical protein